MRWELENELLVFLLSLGEGALLSVLFDLFRMARCPFRWKNWQVAVQDLAYFFLAGVLSFLFLLKESDGVIRSYILAGWLTGWVFWHETGGRLLFFLWGRLCKAAVKLWKAAEKKRAELHIRREKKREEEREKRVAKKRLAERKKADAALHRRREQEKRTRQKAKEFAEKQKNRKKKRKTGEMVGKKA